MKTTGERGKRNLPIVRIQDMLEESKSDWWWGVRGFGRVILVTGPKIAGTILGSAQFASSRYQHLRPLQQSLHGHHRRSLYHGAAGRSGLSAQTVIGGGAGGVGRGGAAGRSGLAGGGGGGDGRVTPVAQMLHRQRRWAAGRLPQTPLLTPGYTARLGTARHGTARRGVVWYSW